MEYTAYGSITGFAPHRGPRHIELPGTYVEPRDLPVLQHRTEGSTDARLDDPGSESVVQSAAPALGGLGALLAVCMVIAIPLAWLVSIFFLLPEASFRLGDLETSALVTFIVMSMGPVLARPSVLESWRIPPLRT